MDGKKQEIRVLVPQGMTRRRLLQILGIAGLGVATGGLLQACTTAPAAPAATTAGSGGTPKLTGPLNMFTWSLFGTPELNDVFTRNTTIEVKPTMYSSSDEMIAKLQGGGTKLYDLAVPVEHYVPIMAQNNLIEPLNKSNLPNLSHVFSEFLNTPGWNPEGKFFGVPFVWGANAIAYNPKLTGGPIDSLDALFDPKFKGKITMRDEPEDTLTIGALKLGIKDPFNMDEKALQEVKKLLISQKPLVRAYWKNIADVQTMMANGDIAVAWSFLAIIEPLRKAGVDAKWIWPKEGAIGWNEGIVAVAGTKNKATVEAYADWTIGAEYGKMLGEKTRYATSSKAAVAAMDPKLVNDLGIDLNNLKRLVFKKIPPNKSRWTEIWNEVKNA